MLVIDVPRAAAHAPAPASKRAALAYPLSSVALIGPAAQRLGLQVDRAAHLHKLLEEAARANAVGKTTQQLYVPLPTDQVFTVTGSASDLPVYFSRLEGVLADRGQSVQVQWAPPQVRLGRALQPRLLPTTPHHSVLLVLRPRDGDVDNQPAKPADNRQRR